MASTPGPVSINRLLNLPVELLFFTIFDRHLTINDVLSLSQTSRSFRNLVYQYLMWTLKTASNPSYLSSLAALIQHPGGPQLERIFNHRIRLDSPSDQSAAEALSPLSADPIRTFWSRYRTDSFQLPPTLENKQLVYLGRVHAAVEYFACIKISTLPCPKPWRLWIDELAWSQHYLIRTAAVEPGNETMKRLDILRRALCRFEMHRQNLAGACARPRGRGNIKTHDLRDACLAYCLLFPFIAGLFVEARLPFQDGFIDRIWLMGLPFIHSLAVAETDQRREILREMFWMARSEKLKRPERLFVHKWYSLCIDHDSYETARLKVFDYRHWMYTAPPRETLRYTPEARMRRIQERMRLLE